MEKATQNIAGRRGGGDKIKLLNQAAKVAKLYYEGGYPQRTIAKSLKLTQPEVSRLIQVANALKIVKHVINPFYLRNLEDDLKDTFPHLKTVIVVPTSFSPGEELEPFLDSLGEAGAKYVAETFASNSSIGVSCGYTVDATIKAVTRVRAKQTPLLPEACKIYPLLIMKEENVSEITPVSLVSNLVRGLPEATGSSFQLPPDRSGKSNYDHHPAITELTNRVKKLDNYLVGIGYIESEHESKSRKNQKSRDGEFNALTANSKLSKVLIDRGARGEIAHQPFDANGDILDLDEKPLSDLKNHFLYLPLETLKQRVKDLNDEVNVLAIGGGSNKVDAIHAALKGKFFNALITDAEVANTILEREGPPNI